MVDAQRVDDPRDGSGQELERNLHEGRLTRGDHRDTRQRRGHADLLHGPDALA